MDNSKVWYITGAFKGIGRSLVEQLLLTGNKVAATSRQISSFSDIVGSNENFLPLSIAGFAPGTGWSIYVASKFAVSGLSEALANELKPLGINVTAVSPGWFRTNFAKPDSIAFGKKQIADYDFMRSGHQQFNEMDGKQLGNPDKVAYALTELVSSSNPPVNFFLGSDAYKRANAKIAQLSQQIEQWKSRSSSTYFEE